MSVKPKWVSQYLDETARKWLIKPRRCNKCRAWCLCVRLCDEYGETFEEMFDPEVLTTPREVATARVLERTIVAAEIAPDKPLTVLTRFRETIKPPSNAVAFAAHDCGKARIGSGTPPKQPKWWELKGYEHKKDVKRPSRPASAKPRKQTASKPRTRQGADLWSATAENAGNVGNVEWGGMFE
ncbi:MAG: hypothetical protein IIY20_05865 [Bifidobacteriaceae bacterium]|nr:hypothetical protein [Bifidobacteriaceae bacterium]